MTLKIATINMNKNGFKPFRIIISQKSGNLREQTQSAITTYKHIIYEEKLVPSFRWDYMTGKLDVIMR